MARRMSAHPLPAPPATTAPGAPTPDQQRRIDAAVAALAPNSHRAYGSAWAAFGRWAEQQGAAALPAAATAVADYLRARAASGASPATLRMARAAVAKVHQVSAVPDPAGDQLVRDTLRTLCREHRDRGRGQAAGIGWAHAEAAASLAANGDGSLAGLRDAAIIRTMSDTLCRISELAALRCDDVAADGDGGGTVTIRASKSDQLGQGDARYLGPATLAAIGRYLAAAGHDAGPLFRQVRKGGHGTADPLGAQSIRAIIRRRAAVVDGITGRIGGHSLRVGSAQELARDGASIAELQQAGGWKSPTTPSIYTRNELAARGPVARRRYQVGA
jgi:integrase